MTICQKHFPTDPSKCVEYNALWGSAGLGVTHISVSKTQRGWKRQSLSLNTNRNLGWALQKNQKAGDFLQLPFYKPHLFRFIFKSLLFAEHIQCTAEGWVLKRLRPRQWPRDNAHDHCFYFSLLFRELCWLNCFPYFRALGESQPCMEHMWSFFWLLLHWGDWCGEMIRGKQLNLNLGYFCKYKDFIG